MATQPSTAQRKLFAKMGYAMPDGSFYIRPLPEGKTDLSNAIMAVGRGEQDGTSGDTIRQFIMKRAAALKLSSEIPDSWNTDGSLKHSATDSPKAPSDAQRKLFAKMGYAMPDGSYYIRPLPLGSGDLQNAIMAVGRGENAGDSGSAIRVHIMKRAKALNLSNKIPDSWNSDGTLKEAAQSSMTLTDFFAHHGVKGMRWGVRNSESKDEEGGSGSSGSAKQSKHDELISRAEAHEAAATAHAKAAEHYAKEYDQVQKNGLNSSAGRRVYGKDASTLSPGMFYAKNGQTKGQAIDQLSNNLRLINNQHGRTSNYHEAKAVKLRTKAAKLEHDALDFDPNFDIDEYLKHFVIGPAMSEDDYLRHFGVKGMHWGVRKAPGEPSEDHARVTELRTKVKTGRGVHVLSNDEIEEINKRLNLESNYSKLVSGGGSSIDKGEKFVKNATSKVNTGVTAIDTGVRAVNTGKAAYKLWSKVSAAK